MARTTTTLVQGVLGAAPLGNWDGATDLTPYIAMATSFVDDAVRFAATRGAIADTGVGSKAELLERWIAAGFYCAFDPLYQSKSNQGASGSFLASGQSLDGETNRFMRVAIQTDTTGTVAALLARKVASAEWLGKIPSNQIPYTQRS